MIWSHGKKLKMIIDLWIEAHPHTLFVGGAFSPNDYGFLGERIT
jgi:hypothetical protein